MENRIAFKSGCVAMIVLGAMLVGCDGFDSRDKKALRKEDVGTGEKASKQNEKYDSVADSAVGRSKVSKVDEAAGKPQKCRLVVEMSLGKEVNLTGYGASLQEAREATMEAAFGIETQLLGPTLLTALAEKTLSHKRSRGMGALLKETAPGISRRLAVLFAPYRERQKMVCKSMTFPIDRIPQWRGVWPTGDASVTVIGTSPTAVIEEARAKACYGQLAEAMLKVSKKSGHGPASRKLKQYAAVWKENGMAFVDCMAQRSSVNPHDGPTRREYKHSVKCSADFGDASSIWRHRNGKPFRVEMVASRVDRARHMVRQELRNILFFRAFADIDLLEKSDKKLTGKAVMRLMERYWNALGEVSSMTMHCQYTGELTGIEWAESEVRQNRLCKTQHPWTAINRPLRQEVSGSLQMSRQALCNPLVQNQLKRIGESIEDGALHHGAEAVGNLGNLIRCYLSCRQDVSYFFENIPAPPMGGPRVELPVSM